LAIGHLEKLWAYLNIQQLMDKYELDKNENSTAKSKALELALEVSWLIRWLVIKTIIVNSNVIRSTLLLLRLHP